MVVPQSCPLSAAPTHPLVPSWQGIPRGQNGFGAWGAGSFPRGAEGGWAAHGGVSRGALQGTGQSCWGHCPGAACSVSGVHYKIFGLFLAPKTVAEAGLARGDAERQFFLRQIPGLLLKNHNFLFCYKGLLPWRQGHFYQGCFIIFLLLPGASGGFC